MEFTVKKFIIPKIHKDQNDHKCLFCRDWCSTNSSCSDRYTGMQGWFEKDKNNPELIICQYICDDCNNRNELEDGNKIKFKNIFKEKGYFVIDSLFRMND